MIKIRQWLCVLATASLLFMATSCQQAVERSTQEIPATLEDASERMQFEWERLKDPRTDEIPVNIRKKELQFARALPSDAFQRNSTQTWTWLGPYNVGGRTRAGGIDQRDPQIILAGGVSGGMWKTINEGQSWYKTTTPDQHHAASCLIQDPRPGKQDIWYYGSGEGTGNSASKSFSALYTGNGIYKSEDNGESWELLQSTVTNTPQTEDNWDYVWRIAIDPSNTSQDEIYAAIRTQIMKSTDGGNSWTPVLSSLASNYNDVVCTSAGVLYACFDFNGQNDGIYRSTDGDNWTRIDQGFPASTDRIVPAIDPNNENIVYFIASTPGAGQITTTFSGRTDANSLYKYEYLSGNGSGSGGQWTNLSSNIPNGISTLGDFNSQTSYNLTIAVQPGNSNNIIIGGTNLYLSTDGFTSAQNTKFIGGYDPNSEIPFFRIYPNHHPDQHWVTFDPTDPNKLVSFNDGGVQKTNDLSADPLVWDDLNRGYITSQFYTVAIDHSTEERFRIIGGLQDNGTYMTFSDNPTDDWTMPETGDGSFCALADDGKTIYTSRQNGRIAKIEVDNSGAVQKITRIDPTNGSNYRFINPFVIDPKDNEVLYVSAGQRLWRNDSLTQLPFDSSWETISMGWHLFSSQVQGLITAMEVSREPAHILYLGTNSRRVYRVDSANAGDPSIKDITSNLSSGSYVSDIAVDPTNADRIMVVYSNYNVYSLWFSENGGDSWQKVAGNLEAELAPGIPPILDGLGDGPSLRCAAIIPHEDGRYTYLVGSSTGLYGTDTLMGDSTFWVQQGAESIGNVVVDMIDFRASDGFTAIATHGNGIYYSYVTNPNAITAAKEKTKNNKLNLFPNPADAQITLDLTDFEADKNQQFRIFSATGKIVHQGTFNQSKRNTLSVSNWPSGYYYVEISDGESYIRTPFIKR